MAPSKRIAVVLAGCGNRDGSEIHEATLTLYAIAHHGAAYAIFAPDVAQHHALNFLTGQELPQERNVLVEAARIARGAIAPLGQLDPGEHHALVIPGGLGVAKNLCTYALDGPSCRVNPEVERAILGFHRLGKPIGALCIAPMLVARVLGKGSLTVGTDPKAIQSLERMGATSVPTGRGGVAVDPHHRLVSCPCYMNPASIADVATEALALVRELLRMC